MKIIDEGKDLVIKIQCKDILEKEKLENFINSYNSNLLVNKDNKSYIVSFNEIYYIESSEKTTFVYTQNNFYTSHFRLYQIEDILNEDFIRINKSTIVNLLYLESMESDIGSRILLEFDNGDRFVVTRAYSKEFKYRLGDK